MKRIKWVLIIVGLLFLVSCGGGGGGGHSNPAPSHAPVIEDVVVYYWSGLHYYATDELSRGDDWYYDITITDPGMDAERVTCTQYYPIDSETKIGSWVMLCESQTAVRTTFYGVDDYTVPYDAQLGNTRFDFQVEDKAGNRSVVFTQFIKILYY